MNCEETRRSLQSFLNGRLSGEESRGIRKHLAGCADCASRLDALDRIEILTALDEEIEPSAHLLTRFRVRVEQHRSRAAESRAGFSWIRRHVSWGRRSQLAAAVFGITILLVAGVYWSRYQAGSAQRGSTINEINIAEKLPLLRDMPVIQNLDLLEDFDSIQSLSTVPTTAPE